MAIEYEVRPATMADALSLHGRLRESDQIEVRAAIGKSADEALLSSLRVSRKAWAGLANGRVEVLFGVGASSLMSLVGVPWMLGADEIESRGIAVAFRSRQYVEEMRKGFTLLENYTDDRHKSAHRWLRWCGFHLEPPAPWGVAGLPFRRFWMNGNV